VVAVTTLTASALAHKSELAGIVGRTFISDQRVGNTNLFGNNLHFGDGLTFQVNHGCHLMGEGFTRLTFEVPAVFDRDEGVHFAANVIPGSSLLVLCDAFPARERFWRPRGVPLAKRGGGMGHFGCPIACSSAVQSPARDQHNFVVGGGVVWRFGTR